MSPEEIVRAELGAWNRRDVDEIMSHFAADAVWVPYRPVNGHEQIRRTVEEYLSHLSYVDFEVLNLGVAGNVVLTERADHLVMDEKPMETRIMSVFEVTGEKITVWRDYFDPQFNHQP